MILLTYHFLDFTLQRKQKRSDEEEEAMKEPNIIDPSLCANLGLVQTGNSEIINIPNNIENIENNSGDKNLCESTKNDELSTIKDDDNDYVVDIYLQQLEQPTEMNISSINNTDSQTPHTTTESTDPRSHIPVMQVDG